jgi:hypothetical protein
MKLILITLLALAVSITCHARISVELARNVDITQARLLADLTAVNGSYPDADQFAKILKDEQDYNKAVQAWLKVANY